MQRYLLHRNISLASKAAILGSIPGVLSLSLSIISFSLSLYLSLAPILSLSLSSFLLLMEQRTSKKLFLCTSSGGEKSLRPHHSGKTQVAPFARNQPFATFFERDLEINWGLFFPGVTLTFGALFLRHLLFSLRLFSPPLFPCQRFKSFRTADAIQSVSRLRQRCDFFNPETEHFNENMKL